MADTDKSWGELSAPVRDSLRASWDCGVPAISSALYGRWWQLETWLRSLVYVELRAAYGSEWVDHLPEHAQLRQEGDQAFHYMETPDAHARLAYTDARGLCEVITKHWDLFETSLLSKVVWSGRMEELLAIRNRIGHCRRPHSDDLARLEQGLRDLEVGALRATSSFNQRRRPDKIWEDPLVKGWVHNEHIDAMRLVGHADRQYETTFYLEYSRRPWAEQLPNSGGISGRRGFLWHACWYFRNAGYFNLRRFWEEMEHVREPIVLVCAGSSNSLEVTFAAIDDAQLTGDIIGRCFDTALENWGRRPPSSKMDEHWHEINADLDSRVHTLSPWTIVADPRMRITLFGA